MNYLRRTPGGVQREVSKKGQALYTPLTIPERTEERKDERKGQEGKGQALRRHLDGWYRRLHGLRIAGGADRSLITSTYGRLIEILGLTAFPQGSELARSMVSEYGGSGPTNQDIMAGSARVVCEPVQTPRSFLEFS
jgi:hypothetical protein